MFIMSFGLFWVFESQCIIVLIQQTLNLKCPPSTYEVYKNYFIKITLAYILPTKIITLLREKK